MGVDVPKTLLNTTHLPLLAKRADGCSFQRQDVASEEFVVLFLNLLSHRLLLLFQSQLIDQKRALLEPLDIQVIVPGVF